MFLRWGCAAGGVGARGCAHTGTRVGSLCHARTLRASADTGAHPEGKGTPCTPCLNPAGWPGGAGGSQGHRVPPEPPSQRPAGEDPSRGAMVGGAARRGGPTLFSLRRRDFGNFHILRVTGLGEAAPAIDTGLVLEEADTHRWATGSALLVARARPVCRRRRGCLRFSGGHLAKVFFFFSLGLTKKKGKREADKTGGHWQIEKALF